MTILAQNGILESITCMGCVALLIAAATALASIIVHLAFALAVIGDVWQRRTDGGTLELVGPLTWSLAALLFGMDAAIGYWLLHCSKLAGEQPVAEAQPARSQRSQSYIRNLERPPWYDKPK